MPAYCSFRRAWGRPPPRREPSPKGVDVSRRRLGLPVHQRHPQHRPGPTPPRADYPRGYAPRQLRSPAHLTDQVPVLPYRQGSSQPWCAREPVLSPTKDDAGAGHSRPHSLEQSFIPEKTALVRVSLLLFPGRVRRPGRGLGDASFGDGAIPEPAPCCPRTTNSRQVEETRSAERAAPPATYVVRAADQASARSGRERPS